MARRSRSACTEALFERFLPLARRPANRYHNPHEPLEDLIQVAGVGLLCAIDRFDPDHGIRVAELSIATARELGLAEHEITRIGLAAQLHDIGKTAIPESILNKPGALDDEEWAFVRSHILIGERIVAAAPSLAHTATLVRSSHERLDGNGYPDRLPGDDIPLGSRIIAVCDAYDAMIVPRPYRNPRCVPDALSELQDCAGSQFDPCVVNAFVTVAPDHETLVSTPTHPFASPSRQPAGLSAACGSLQYWMDAAW